MTRRARAVAAKLRPDSAAAPAGTPHGALPRGGPFARTLRHPLAADIAVAAAAALLAAVESVDNPHLGPCAPWLNLVLGVVVALTLLARRRAPELVIAISLAAHLVHLSNFTLFFAFYAEGAYRGPQRRSVVWCTALVGFAAVCAPQDAGIWQDPRRLLSFVGALFVLQVLVPLLLGLYMGERRAVLRALVDRAERAEREQALIADAAVAEERRRIAGEMHDVVSHQVSLMVVHAHALQKVAGDRARAQEAADTIATAGRQALGELRDMIGVLRRPAAHAHGYGQQPGGARAQSPQPGTQTRGPGGGTEPAPAPYAPAPHSPYPDGPYADGPKSPEPQGSSPHSEPPSAEHGQDAADDPQSRTAGNPSLSRVPALVAASRSAGLPVELRTAGEPQPLAESTERAAYRVIQEALTNVHKHAAGAATEVLLTYRSGTLRVSVLNSSPPAAGSAAGTPDAADPLLPSGGHGLIGLRERVRLAGGGIETGPRPGGGFLVVAELPCAAAQESDPYPSEAAADTSA